jgi:glycosyltransferase involved in cell wall biosynthesis
MTPAVSVIICTHDRAPLLDAALEALCNQALDSPEYEVIAVDNASTDDTAACLGRWAARWPVRVRLTREDRLGLSFARNAGVTLAEAPIVAFTDDDVRVAGNWIKTIAEQLAAHPEAGWMGGRVLPKWAAPPPRRVTNDRWAPMGLQDHGDRPFPVGAGRPLCLIGANLAVRTPLLRQVGGFDPFLQRVGDGIGSTEDHELQEQLWRRGLVGRYEPALVVHAIVDRDRLTARYHRRWHRGHGRFVARMQLPEMEAYGGRRCLNVPLHVLRSTNAWFALGFVEERLAHPPPRPRPIDGLTSIVIPCYNQAPFLAEAIQSALSQPACEVIVIDDGSTDDSASVASRFVNARLLRQANRGLVAARNAGLHAARGEFVLFLDSDDRLRPGAIQALRSALQSAAAAAFAFGPFVTIDAAGRPAPATPPVRQGDRLYEALLRSNFICAPGAVLYRRGAVLDAGGFHPGDAAADYDLYLRLARDAPAVTVREVVAEYRTHPGSMSRNAGRMLRETRRVHGRAKKDLRDDEERRAWREGRSGWRAFYGTQLVEEIRRHWRGRRLAPLAAGLFVLARYAPGVLWVNLERKLASLFRTIHRTRYTAKRPSS